MSTQEAVGNHVAPNMPAPLAAKPSDNLTPEQLAHRAEKAANNKFARETLRKADAGDEEAKATVAKWMPGVETAVRAAVNEENGNESKENQNGESAGTENQVEKSAGTTSEKQNETAEEVSKEKAPAKAEDGKHDYVIGGKHMRLTRKDAKRERAINNLQNEPVDEIKSKLIQLAEDTWNGVADAKQKVQFAASEKLRNEIKKLLGTEIRIITVTRDSFQHVKKHHASSREQLRGQKTFTPHDAGDLYDAINDFDSLSLEKPDSMGNSQILVIKGEGNRSYVLLVQKGETNANVKTAWKTVKKRPPRVVSGNNASSLYVQNADGHPVSSLSPTVSQLGEKSKKYTSKSYKVSHNKSFKAITKNGVIVVKDGARGKGELYENDESYNPTLYGRTLINIPIDDVTKAVKDTMNPHSAIEKLVRPKLEKSIDKIIADMDPKKKDPYSVFPEGTLKEMCQKWWDEMGRASNEFSRIVDANRDAVEDVYGQYLKDHPDILQAMHPSIKREVMNVFHPQ